MGFYCDKFDFPMIETAGPTISSPSKPNNTS
jgi:hypothetical protein